MSKIILDFCSGNTCKNNWEYAKRMIDELKAVDTGKHEVILKWQLFLRVGENIPLRQEIFYKAYNYANNLGYKTTASVFDKESLNFLLEFPVPFIKIANNRKLDWIIGEIPRRIPVYKSVSNYEERTSADKYLCCVSEYPSRMSDYEDFDDVSLIKGISDHTVNFNLFKKYIPDIVEWHYKLSDSTGLDAGPFARTPEELQEVLR